MFKLFTMVLIYFFSLTQINAQQLDGKIAVLQLVNKAKIDTDDVSYLTTQIQEKIQEKTVGKYQVMTQENILTLLPPDKKLEDCVASECEVDTGRILGAELIVTGQIVKFGTQKDLRCTIKLHETKTGTLLSSQTIKAKNIDQIESQLLDTLDKLLNKGLSQSGTQVINSITNTLNGVNLDGEILALEKHFQEVKSDWEKIKVMGMDKDKSLIIGKAIELFLKKYEGDDKGNPFEKEAHKLLKEIQIEKSEIQISQSNLNIDMILIKGGSFMMGSDHGNANEKPIHRVDIKDFYMSKTEITVGQYKKCIDVGVCSLPHWDDGSCTMWNGDKWVSGIIGSEFKGEYQPVVCINWKQAREFAKWMGGDLPTEAQWEYASRSRGKDIKYPWGNLEPTCEITNFNHNCHKATTPVCSKINGNTEQGLCDMGGNAWEWVLDEYHDSYSNAPSNDIEWCSDSNCSSNSIVNRILRGGSCQFGSSDLRSTIRHHLNSEYRGHDLSFRITKSIR